MKNIRPYSNAVEEFDQQIATIVLRDNGGTLGGMWGKINAVNDFLTLETPVISALPVTVINNNIQLESSEDIKAYKDAIEKSSFDISQSVGVDPDNPSYYYVFNNFSLTNVNEQEDEIININQHFGDSFNAFVFGTSPKVYSFTGVFIDGRNMPYYQEFMHYYEKVMKASKSSVSGLNCYICYSGKILNGFMLNIRVSTDGAQEKIKGFTFTFLVKSIDWVRNNIVTNIDGSEQEGLNAMKNAWQYGGINV